MQKFSIGFETILRDAWVLSSDYVHTDGFDEGRVQVINPQIRSVCDPTFAGSTPSSPRCVAGAEHPVLRRRLRARRAWAPGRLGQINMIGTTNESNYDSLTTTLRGRVGQHDAVGELRAGELARVGRPADRVLQRQRRRDQARGPVQRRGVGTDPARRAAPAGRQRRRRPGSAASRSRRSSSGRRRGPTRRPPASTATATA